MKKKKENKFWVTKKLSNYATMTDTCAVSCTTFNILAPIYKRLDKEDQTCRESQHRADWLSRNRSIIDRLLDERSSIICLQEVWLGNEELVYLYEKSLGEAGYTSLKLARTNNRGDGLLTAVRKDHLRVLNYRELLFNDFGDRVAQLLHVESVVPFWQSRIRSVRQQILIVNTHLLFPHDYSYCIFRLRQVYKILQYIESYQSENILNTMPIILCGDWNGSKRGHVYKFLRSQGFVSSYDAVHQYTDSDADAHKWVSHRNHRGNICGVDFIWLRNPEKYLKPLKTSWNEALLGIVRVSNVYVSTLYVILTISYFSFQHLLRLASLTDENAFAFLKGDGHGDYMTFSGFCQALSQLGITGQCQSLSTKELQELWAEVDTDGDDIVDYKEFQHRIWSPLLLEKPKDNPQACALSEPEIEQRTMDGQAFGFSVKNAVLFPPEVEKGTWPENYSLSDHAPLTVVFSPVRMPGSQMIG